MGALIIAGFVLIGGWFLLQRMAPAVPAAPGVAPSPPIETPESSAADALMLGANYIESGGTAAAATMAGFQVGAMTIEQGATAGEAAGAAAISAALLGGGPLGAAIAGTLAVFAEQADLMAHIDRRNAIWSFITPAELSIWKGKKSKAESNLWDPTAHRAVENYETLLINKYTSSEGVADFQERADLYSRTGHTANLTSAGLTWLAERGLVYTQRVYTEEERAYLEAISQQRVFMRYALQHLTPFEREALTEEERQLLLAKWYGELTATEKRDLGIS